MTLNFALELFINTMAHTKSQGAVKGNRDSVAKRLGVKIYGGQNAKIGNIILRQKGTKFYPGKGTSLGKDYTLFATSNGIVNFRNLRGKKVVEIISN